MSPLTSLMEYLSLGRARAQAAALAPADRDALRALLERARQRADGSETLWSTGHLAEGLRLASDAFAAAWEIVEWEAARSAEPKTETDAEPESETDAEPESEADAEPESESETVAEPESETVADADADSWKQILAERGATTKAIERIAAGLAARVALVDTLPTFDADVERSHERHYQAMARGRREIDELFMFAASRPRELAMVRLRRVTILALLLAAALGAGGYVMLAPPSVEVVASGVWGNRPDFQPEKAIDGEIETEWVTPDGEEAWIEARLSRGIDISRVIVRNGFNPPFNDRAIQTFKVELFQGGEPVSEVEGEFDALRANPSPLTLALEGEDIDRIRLTITGWHGASGALSELSWE